MDELFSFLRSPDAQQTNSPTPNAELAQSTPTATLFSELRDPGRAFTAPDILTQSRVGKEDWDTTSGKLKTAGLDPAEYQGEFQQQRLARAKAEEGTGTSTGEQFARHSLPFVSAIRSYRGEKRYASAMKRLQEGKASEDDYKEIASYERLAAVDQRMGETVGGQMVQALGAVPAIMGEMMTGGAAVARIGQAAKIAPALTRGGQALRYAGRAVPITAMAPSMYLEQAARKNMENGREPGDPRGFIPALGLGYANTLVLGSLQEFGNSGYTIAERAAAKAVIGVGEQQGVDVATSLIDEALPKAYKMGTRYGLIGNLARGEGGEALKHATVQMFTFATFAGLHDRGATPAKAAERVQELAQTFTEAVDSGRKRGESKDATGRYLAILTQRLSEAMHANPEITREQAAALFPGERVKDPAVRRYLDGLLKAVPEAPKESVAQSEELTRTEPQPGAELTRTEPQPGTEPVRDRSPEEVLTADEIRQFAKDSGFAVRKNSKVSRILAQIAESPSAKVRLARLVAERSQTAPESPQAAPEARPTETPPEPEIAPPASAQEPAAGLRIGSGADLKELRDLNPAEKHALGKYGNGQRIELVDASGKPAATATIHESSDTGLTVSWMGAKGLGGGEGRGKHPFGPREVVQLMRQLAKALPEFETVTYTPSEGRIRAGEARTVELAKFREKTTEQPPAAEPTPPPMSRGERLLERQRAKQAGQATESPKGPVGDTPIGIEKPTEEQRVPYAERVKAEEMSAQERKAEAKYERVPFESLPPATRRRAEELIGQLVAQTGVFPGRLQDTVRAAWIAGGEKELFKLWETRLARYGDPETEHLLPAPTAEELALAEKRAAKALKERRRAEREVQRIFKSAKGKKAKQQAADSAEQGLAVAAGAGEAARDSGENPRPAQERQEDSTLLSVAGKSAADVVRDQVAEEAAAAAHADKLAKEYADKAARLKDRQQARAAAARAKKAAPDQPAEGDFYAENDLRKKYGAVTMYDDIRSRGGISEASVRSAGLDAKALREEPGLKDVIRPNGKQHVEDLISEYVGGGFLPRDATPDQFVEAVRSHTLLEGGRWPQVELEREQARQLRAQIEEDVHRDPSNEKLTPKQMQAKIDKRVQEETYKAEMARAEAERIRKGEYEPAESTEEIPFSPPRGASATAASGKGEKVRTPFEILATARELFDTPNYNEAVAPGGGPDRIAYVSRAGATVTGKFAQGDAARGLHDIAHHVAAEGKLTIDPESLPRAVAAGLKAFDYEPRRRMGRVAMMEGFAEWFRRRAQDELTNLTPEQKAANDHLERWVKDKGLTEKADRVREMFRQYAGQSAVQQAAGLVSGTGRPASAALTSGETVAVRAETAGERFNEAAFDDIAVVRRIEAELERRGRKLEPGERASTLLATLTNQEQAIAGDMAKNGAWTLMNGKRVRIGESLDKVLEGLKPEEMSAGPDGTASKFGTYAVAKHVLGEKARGRETVAPEQLEVYERAMAEFEADADFMQRADAAAQRLTAAFLASRQVLESAEVHFFEPGTTQRLADARPDYVPLDRVLDDPAGKGDIAARRRGERPGKLLYERTGSAAPIVDPIISYQKRLLGTASVLAKQMKVNAVMKLLSQPGMGDFALFGEKVPTKEAERIQRQALDVLSMSGQEVENMLRELESGRGLPLFTYKPWADNPNKATVYWNGPGGELTNVRVKDRALYELLTDQQIDANQTARIAAGIANFSIFGWKPMSSVASLVRKGATVASMGFQVRNMFPTRDPLEFLKNTVDRATAKDLPATYKQLFAFYWQRFIDHARGREFVPENRLLAEFVNQRGEDLRQFTEFNAKRPETAYAKAQAENAGKAIKTVRSVWGLAKDLLAFTGAGELAPRFLEWKTRLKQLTGKTEAQLEAMFKAADQAAADGKPHVEPIPFALLAEGMNAAAEVTVNFGRQGTVTRQLNNIQPFFGPAVSGFSKAVRNWRDNWKGAAIGAGGILALRLAHWLAFGQEDWWRELQSHDRFNNFVVPTPLGLRRLPGPRDLDVFGGGVLTTVLDAASGANPDFRGLVERSLSSVTPPVPMSPVGQVAWDLRGNKTWMGSPIVPDSAEGAGAVSNALNYQLPYAAEQLTGGRGTPSLKGLGLVPFSEVKNATRSVKDFYERLEELRSDSLAARKRGERFASESEYKRLEKTAAKLKEIHHELRGEKLSASTGRLVKTAEPSEARRKELKARELELARRALATP